MIVGLQYPPALRIEVTGERMNKEVDKSTVSIAYEELRKDPPRRHERSDRLHHRVLPFATLAPWLNDKDFLEIYQLVKSHTLVDMYRCYELWALAKQCDKVDGDILEVGVWRGGTGAILAAATKSFRKKVFLADTFKGVVKAGDNDTVYKGGEHADTSVDLVASLLSSIGLKNTVLLEGIFPDETYQKGPEKIALLHCDVDVYSSSKDIVEWCLPRMDAGAVLVFDDYGFFGCEGVAKYCDELRTQKNLVFVHNLNGHAVFVKI